MGLSECLDRTVNQLGSLVFIETFGESSESLVDSNTSSFCPKRLNHPSSFSIQVGVGVLLNTGHFLNGPTLSLFTNESGALLRFSQDLVRCGLCLSQFFLTNFKGSRRRDETFFSTLEVSKHSFTTTLENSA